MSHFYGAVSGQAGETTRMGSQNSGIRSYVQSHTARISAYLGHDRSTERDSARIIIGEGYSTYFGTRSLHIEDIDAFARAICSDDERVKRIWDRIVNDFAKLEQEAPKALKRAERRRRQESRAVAS
jgi:hypothetical protein